MGQIMRPRLPFASFVLAVVAVGALQFAGAQSFSKKSLRVFLASAKESKPTTSFSARTEKHTSDLHSPSRLSSDLHVLSIEIDRDRIGVKMRYGSDNETALAFRIIRPRRRGGRRAAVRRRAVVLKEIAPRLSRQCQGEQADNKLFRKNGKAHV